MTEFGQLGKSNEANKEKKKEAYNNLKTKKFHFLCGSRETKRSKGSGRGNLNPYTPEMILCMSKDSISKRVGTKPAYRLTFKKVKLK